MTRRHVAAVAAARAACRWLAANRSLLLGGCALLVLIWTGLAYHLSQTREAETSQARRDVTNISVALAEQVARLVDETDQILRLMQEDFARDPQRFDLKVWIARSASLRPMADQLAIFDEHGDLTASETQSAPGTAKVNIADRDQFRFLAAHPQAGLSVGRTVIGRIMHARVFNLARRLVGPDGVFRGMVAISINPDYIARQFSALDVGADGSVALFGLDGYVRARTPVVEGMYDLLKLPSRKGVFQELKRSPVGTYHINSAYDGTLRIFGYRTVDALPLVVVVGKSEDLILAPFRIELRRALLVGGTASALIVLLIAALLRGSMLRRSKERALAEAEASFRGVFEASTDLLWIFRIADDGKITIDRLNPAAAAWHSIDQATRGKSLSDILSPHVFEEARARVAHVVMTGETLRLQDDRTLEDGRIVEIVLVPLFAEKPGHRIERVFVSIRDIGHLRQAETAIARSEARYRMLAETTSDVITSLDLDFNRTYVSPACRRLFGYEPEEMTGQRPSGAMHPDDAPRIRELARQLISGEVEEARLTATYRTQHKHGHWFWVEAGITLGRDEAGTPCGLICSLRDVTERREAEAALEASEARFRLLAENTSELIILGHDDGRRSYISPASIRILGYTPAELAAMHFRDWVHDDDLPRLQAATLVADREASGTAIVYRVRHKDGRWIWIEGIFRRMPDARPEEPTIVGTFRDVSERQAQAEALREAKEAAEQARQIAEQASQAKSDFLAAMSHEIRTPLNGVLGYADLLLADDGIDGMRRVHLRRIQNAGSALRTVVDDILDFSKIEAGEIELVLRAFSPASLIENAFSIVKGLADSKGLDLVLFLGQDVPKALIGDHDRLRQILLNLLNNALKFTRTGSVTLSVLSRLDADARAVLRFAVADTGIGIAEEKRSRLFKRFSQVDGSISREYGGTGLGLAISRSLVEAMGGIVGVDSVLGEGSTFWFEVTLPSAATVATASLRENAALVERPASILLAEDNSINQDIARAVLEAAGHIVDVVDDGEAAVAAVISKVYDLVLMDVQMPVMDGLTATRRIRALDARRRDVPIVAMTANVLPLQLVACREAGMDDHVGKPFKRIELLAAVGRCRRPAGEASAAEGTRAPAPDAADVDAKTAAVGRKARGRLSA